MISNRVKACAKRGRVSLTEWIGRCLWLYDCLIALITAAEPFLSRWLRKRGAIVETLRGHKDLYGRSATLE